MTPWEKFKHDWHGKKVTIMGLGLQGGGEAVARTFAEVGSHVTVTDLKKLPALKQVAARLKEHSISYHLGGHRETDFTASDLIIRNPAVPSSSTFLRLAAAHHVPIKMETALFATYFRGLIIGVTGTRGKSTTAHLIAHILQAAKKPTILAGNVPKNAALPHLKHATPDHLVVLELSSWQLQGFAKEKISPHIAVITNIYPDHLNRYRSMSDYASDKEIITRFQTAKDILILNRENKRSRTFATGTKAQVDWFAESDLGSQKLVLKGGHNRANAAAALKVTQALGLDKAKTLKSLSSFKGLPGRLEVIAVKNGITIINDTTSTTPIATRKALEVVSPPITLVVGGQTKNLPLKKLAATINNQVSHIVLLEGSGTTELQPLLDPQKIVGPFKDQAAAIKKSLSITPKGGTLLFSPAFTSFDMFANEFERGDAFNSTVSHLT
ncbi:MAG: UDP-N-acetylmuramoyl-L-alanine--D-glutamate ligase [Candidatus Chisholmbacteria bacterium]|nr:UDP-N-acetylmuramoyl-L-alanine--D-glutamate ligase [Candidatus Chisholmbacteria bacterium]